MAINKVVYDNRTLIDLTGDTVSESDVPSGVRFHLPSGVQTVGTATEKYIYQDASGYVRISDTLPDSSAMTILSVIPRSEITIDHLVDANGNQLVDSSGNQIVTVGRS